MQMVNLSLENVIDLLIAEVAWEILSIRIYSKKKNAQIYKF